MEVKHGALQDKSFLNWKLSNFYFIIVWERVYVCACACPYRTSMNFARPPSSKAEMTHETPQNRSFFVSYLVQLRFVEYYLVGLGSQAQDEAGCWWWRVVLWWQPDSWNQVASLGNPREFKKPDVSICLYKYTRIIIYIYIFEIWHLFEFIVFVQWFLYCWIRGSWRPYDQEVSVASLTLPDNLMRRLMRTGTVKGGELMTSGLNEGDLIARPYLSDDGWV